MTPIHRGVMILMLTLAASIGASALRPEIKLSDSLPAVDLEVMIPKSFGDWKMEKVSVQALVSPDVQANLKRIYDQTLGRVYTNRSGARIFLSMAYGGAQTQELKAHRQEVCYSAQGFQVSEVKHVGLELGGKVIPGTRMLAVQGARFEPVTYWFTMGNKVVLSIFERLLTQIKYSFRGQIPDGFLVRVSSLDMNRDVAYKRQLDFVNQLIESVTPQTRSRLVGD